MRPVSDDHRVTQEFGEGATAGVAPSSDPASGVGYLVWLYGNYQPDGHAGADIGCEVGTPVRATRAGTVVWCDWDVNLPGNDSWGPGGYFDRWAFYKSFGGRIIVIQYAPGDLDVYAHLSQFKVSQGQPVNEGDIIALSGDSSGGHDGVLGPHLHTERIVDTTNYPTGGGMIYGRIDPSTLWGAISAQSATITPEGLFMSLTPEEEQRILAAADRINGVVADVKVLNASDGAYMNSTRDAQHASVMAALATLFSKADGAWQNGVLANLPAKVLNQPFTLPDGTATNLAGILGQIHAKPAAVPGAPAAVDVDALVARLKAELPAAQFEYFKTQITK